MSGFRFSLGRLLYLMTVVAVVCGAYVAIPQSSSFRPVLVGAAFVAAACVLAYEADRLWRRLW